MGSLMTFYALVKEVWKCCPLPAYQVTVTYNSSQNYVLLSSEKGILVMCEVMC